MQQGWAPPSTDLRSLYHNRKTLRQSKTLQREASVGTQKALRL